MPPKPKFGKAEIINAGLTIAKNEGLDQVTARSIAKTLGSSVCPVFSYFDNMEHLKNEIVVAAKAEYKKYVKKGLCEDVAFKGVGKQYILFAVQEPKLFRLLFMSEKESVPNLSSILPEIDESYEQILNSIVDGYGFSTEKAEWLYKHLWIYTHGIATLCATKMCRFADDEISKMMTEVCKSLIVTLMRGDI